MKKTNRSIYSIAYFFIRNLDCISAVAISNPKAIVPNYIISMCYAVPDIITEGKLEKRRQPAKTNFFR